MKPSTSHTSPSVSRPFGFRVFGAAPAIKALTTLTALAALASACDGVYPGPSARPTPDASPTPSPSPTPTPNPSPNPTPSPSPSPTPTPTPSPNPSPSPSPNPTPNPTCAAPGWTCESSNVLAHCTAGVVETWTCDSVCQGAGYDRGIGCGDDEAGVPTCFCEDLMTPSPTTCPVGFESCGDGTCVDSAYVCDGYSDCNTGYDELGCATCSFGGGTCNGNNHVDYCEGGGITTLSCDDLCRQSGFDYSEGCSYDPAAGSDSCLCNNFASCFADEFTCGDNTCLPNEYVCDGYADCPGSTDEVGCVSDCIPGDTYCTGGYTLEVCNGYGTWEVHDCDDVCQMSGYAYADSCGYDTFAGQDACFCDF